jgi:hypothetical protein
LLPSFHTPRRAQTLPISFDSYPHNDQIASTWSQRAMRKVSAYIVKNHLELIKLAFVAIQIIVAIV